VGVNVFLWLVVGDNIFWFWWNAIGAIVTLTVGVVASELTKARAKSAQTIDMESTGLASRQTLILLAYFVAIVLISISLRFIIG
jgi:hypothetical protein